MGTIVVFVLILPQDDLQLYRRYISSSDLTDKLSILIFAMRSLFLGMRTPQSDFHLLVERAPEAGSVRLDIFQAKQSFDFDLLYLLVKKCIVEIVEKEQSILDGSDFDLDPEEIFDRFDMIIVGIAEQFQPDTLTCLRSEVDVVYANLCRIWYRCLTLTVCSILTIVAESFFGFGSHHALRRQLLDLLKFIDKEAFFVVYIR